MLLCAFFNSLPNFFDIETNFPRNYNKLVLCRQSFIGGNKLVKMATMYWKLPSWEMVSDRKRLDIYTIYSGYFESFFVFTRYFVVVLFRRRVCYSVIAESFKQIYEFFFSAWEGWNLTEVQVWYKGNMYHAHALTKTTLPLPTTMLILQIVKIFPG